MRMLDYKQWMELLNKIFSNLLVLLKRGQVSVFIVEIIHSSSSKIKLGIRFMSMAFNATFDDISVIFWRSVLLMEETGVPGENHRPAVSHWQTYHIMLYWVQLAWAGFELTTLVKIGTNCIKFNLKQNYRYMCIKQALH